MKKFVVEIFSGLTHTVHFTIVKADSVKDARNKALAEAGDEHWAINVKEIQHLLLKLLDKKEKL